MTDALPDDLLLRTPEEAARRISLAFLDQARAAAERLDDAADTDALHDFRVSIRRLRSAFRAWRRILGNAANAKRRRRLRNLQAGTGGGRDAEVLLEWLEPQRAELSPGDRLGLDWLIDRLRDRKEAAYGEVRGRIRERFEQIDDDLRERLDVMTTTVHLTDPAPAPTYAEALAKAARKHVDELVRRITAIGGRKERERAHDARIAGKRLRYLLEPAREQLPEAKAIVRRIKELQDLLGDMNDAAVLVDELADAIGSAAAVRARRLHELAVEGDGATLEREQQRSEHEGLLEVTRRAQARHQALHGRLVSEWIEEGAGALSRDVHGLCDMLVDLARQDVEIERKYLLSALPARVSGVTPLRIDQGYIPGDRLHERLRRTQEGDGPIRRYRTVKIGRGIRRVEIEEEAPEALFDSLWALTEGRRVQKRRYRVEDDGRVWEIDEFTDRDLVLAEVELDAVDSEVDLPAWLAPLVVREVTDESAFVNLNLAR